MRWYHIKNNIVCTKRYLQWSYSYMPARMCVTPAVHSTAPTNIFVTVGNADPMCSYCVDCSTSQCDAYTSCTNKLAPLTLRKYTFSGAWRARSMHVKSPYVTQTAVRDIICHKVGNAVSKIRITAGSWYNLHCLIYVIEPLHLNVACELCTRGQQIKTPLFF